MSASSEFIDLCRTQVTLLAQNFGAASSAVYLTENWVGTAEPKLVPVVTYPAMEPKISLVSGQGLLPSSRGISDVSRWANPDSPESPASRGNHLEFPSSLNSGSDAAVDGVPGSSVPMTVESRWGSGGNSPESPFFQRQIALPLLYEGVVVGVLVTARPDRRWNQVEQTQLKQVAQMLAIARVLDQRSQWFEQKLRQNQKFQAQQADLLHTLLHQFRNPLTALRTFGKLMLKRLQPEDNNYTAASGIVRESDRLQELLRQFNTVVDFGDANFSSKALNSGDFQDEIIIAPDGEVNPVLDPKLLPAGSSAALLQLPNTGFGHNLTLTACRVTDILRPLLESAGAIAEERRLDLQSELPHELAPVWADPMALVEVLSNLIDNALKYAPAGSQITVFAGLQRQGDSLETTEHPHQGILVADTGPGIPAADLNQIFERHYRGVQAQSDTPGTGLGLAISQDLMVAMQGEIEVFSPAIHASGSIRMPTLPPATGGGPGTAFIIWLLEA